MLSDNEKKELKDAARSLRLREDMQKLSKTRHNPFLINGSVNLDSYVTFLTEYNHFINHSPKLFRKIIDKDMRF